MRPLIIALLLLLCAATTNTALAQRTVRINIDKADFLMHDDKIGKNTQSLNGHVKLSHGNVVLFCDSAYMYNDSNVVICYSNVHVIQNDSIHLYGNKMTYYGDISLVKVRENVRANKGDTWLYTEFLDYDRLKDQAYFYNGGRVENGENILVSRRGFYYPMTNDVYFKDDVVGTSPRYNLISDTASFNTKTEIITILGPTTITTTDSAEVRSEKGWYNTKTEVAKLLQNNLVYSLKKHTTLQGKTILYERQKSLGTAWNDMVLTDSANNMVIKGDYGFANQLTDEALATKRAEVQHIYKSDTLFMHADTFRIVSLPDSGRLIKAFYNVKAYRPDLQARCDSMVFDSRDSIATLYHDPIVWSEANQMTANVIKLYTRNQVLYKAELIDAAFVISLEEDSVGFDQVKGKLITGYIRNNEVHLIDVSGNGQTIYYPKDGPNLIGVNRAESSDMSIRLKDGKINSISMHVSPTGNMNPPFLIGEENCKLAGFRWLEDYRPKCKADIFRRLDIPEDLLNTQEVYEGYEFDDIDDF